MTYRRCPTCGQDIAAEFAAYNRGVRRARDAYFGRRGAGT